MRGEDTRTKTQKLCIGELKFKKEEGREIKKGVGVKERKGLLFRFDFDTL